MSPPNQRSCETQNCRWPGFGTSPVPSGWAQSAGGQVTEGQTLPGCSHPSGWPQGLQRIPLTLWLLLYWDCHLGRWETWRGSCRLAPGKVLPACLRSTCARKVAIAQPVGNQEINCVGEREREGEREGGEKLELLCGWV